MSARAGRLAMLVVAAAALTGCVVLPPPLPTAAPAPVTPAPQATSSAPEPTQVAPSQPPTDPAPSEPAATDPGNELPPPTLAECTAADEALAAIVTRSSQVLDAVPADGAPDWAAADAVVAELPAMRDAFIASTTSVALAESFRELDEPIASMAEAVASRDDLSVILRSASVALAAPGALLPCAGIL
ncbi:hypothetical protein [Agrococcus citreus]|uniref:Uncharacterized protein n=1 Tax=Agrococcus citreus TaxID=84643 RepID=A0ABN1YPU1_9MICO